MEKRRKNSLCLNIKSWFHKIDILLTVLQITQDKEYVIFLNVLSTSIEQRASSINLETHNLLLESEQRQEEIENETRRLRLAAAITCYTLHLTFVAFVVEISSRFTSASAELNGNVTRWRRKSKEVINQ